MVNEEVMLYPHSEMWLRRKTKAQVINSKNTDGSQARYTKLKGARDKGCIMHDSVYITNCKRQSIEAANRSVAAGDDGWGGGVTIMGNERPLGR